MKHIILAVLLALSSTGVWANGAQTWILLGDSIMSAVYPSVVGGGNGHMKDMAPHLLEQERNISIRNLSSPGHNLGSATFGFANVVPTIRNLQGYFNNYKGIIIQAGTNDFGGSGTVTAMVNSLNAILTEAQAKNKKVLMVDPIWRRNEASNNSQGLPLLHYRVWMVWTCDNYPNTCHFASRTGTVFDNSSGSMYYNANEIAAGMELHLNTAGHRKWADWVKAEAASQGWF